MRIEDAPVGCRVTWARSRHGSASDLADRLSRGEVSPDSLEWVRRPAGDDLRDMRGVQCVAEVA